MLLDYLILCLIIVVIIKIVLVMVGVDSDIVRTVSGIMILLFSVIILIVIFSQPRHRHHKPLKPPRITETYVGDLKYINGDKFFVDRAYGKGFIFNAEINMVEESLSKDNTLFNEIAGGYHEEFNILVPETTPGVSSEDTLLTWVSNNGTIIKFIKIGNQDAILFRLTKSDNVNVMGDIKIKVKAKNIPPAV